MHKKLQEEIETALAVIKSQLKEKFKSKEISEEIYKEIVREFANIIHSKEDSKGYKYTSEALRRIRELSNEIDNDDWHAAVGDVTLTLDGRNPLVGKVICEIFPELRGDTMKQLSEEDESALDEFWANEKESMYSYLLGKASGDIEDE